MGGAWTYEASYTVQASDADPLVNTVTVSGEDRDGEAVADATDSHSTDIDFAPALDVVKSGPVSATVGQSVTYSFALTNDAVAGDGSPISVTGVSDDVAGAGSFTGGDTNGNGLLEVGETWTYEASYTVLVTDADPLVNTVTVSGTDADGEAITDATDSHSTDIDFAPALDVVKSGPASATVGQSVTYSFSVTNDAVAGDGSPITVAGVSDDVAGAGWCVGGDTNGNGLLEVGETWTYEAT